MTCAFIRGPPLGLPGTVWALNCATSAAAMEVVGSYGAAESAFGSRTPGDLPVDSHELIALVAPRWVFVSYGVPEKGDANWLDHQGSYMAVVAAGPVFRLLGARDIGDTRDYHVAKMPGVNVGLVSGELAWRQHDGGHEDRSNMTHFIEWADRLMATPKT